MVLAMLLGMAITVFGQVDTSGSAEPTTPRWLSVGGAIGGGPTLDLGAVVIPELIDCDTLRRGIGASWGAALLVDRPLSDTWSLQARVGLAIERGELRKKTNYPLLLRTESGGVVEGIYDHVLLFDRTRIAATILGRWASKGPIELAAGIELARRIAGRETFEQEAVTPSTLLLRGQRIAEIRSGAIVEPSALTLGALGSIGFRLPLSSRSWLVPELSVAMPITSMASSMPWRSLRVSAGASLRFDLHEAPPPKPIDTPVIVPAPVLRPVVTTSPAVVEVRVDEYDSTEALALLNQVFFEEGSATIPPRYHLLDDSAAARFSTSQLVGSALEAYYDLLNIIGLRMKRTPEATLAINGYRNGREPGGSALSRARAEEIRRYLVETWGIAARRLRVSGGALPPSPARESVEEGFEENARVQIEPSDPNITGPVIRLHTKRTATPPSVLFFPRAEAEAGVRSWRLDVVQDSTLWRRFEGEGALPDSILWDWRSGSRELPTIPMRLSYRLEVEDSAAQRVATAPVDIRVDYRTVQQTLEHHENDSIIASYSLLLFNFDSPNVSPADQELLRAIATSGIDPRSVVTITGYTDSLGLESHNRELAMRRASETARQLRELAPAGAKIFVSGSGGERERFPYDTPEGRSHCRTVVIEVRTPAVKP
jgi:outer membrane protein OmpA-like peptidoglycan-associated protein